MSIFEYRKRPADLPPNDSLYTLRTTLEKLAQAEETPRTADLKRILTGRIAEMERRQDRGSEQR